MPAVEICTLFKNLPNFIKSFSSPVLLKVRHPPVNTFDHDESQKTQQRNVFNMKMTDDEMRLHLGQRGFIPKIKSLKLRLDVSKTTAGCRVSVSQLWGKMCVC